MNEIEKAEDAVRQAQAVRDAAVAAAFPKGTVCLINVLGRNKEYAVAAVEGEYISFRNEKSGTIRRHYSNCQIIKKGE